MIFIDILAEYERQSVFHHHGADAVAGWQAHGVWASAQRVRRRHQDRKPQSKQIR
jgi:hypothetical protein